MAFGLHDRRSVLAGLTALCAARPALAQGAPASPVAHGVLKDNLLAQAFESAPAELPDIAVVGPNGERSIAELLKGRTVLMPIWAEWCLPCLTELPDFARLQTVYGKGKFAIIPILSGAKRQMTPDAIGELFGALNARVFEPLVEKHDGSRLMEKMSRKGNQIGIPCNVLIGPDGRVIAREMGLKSNHPDADKDDDKDLKDSERAARIAQAFANIQKAAGGETQSLWGTPAGDEFATAMSIGFFG